MGSAGLGASAIYDAIIGATAREHDATLLTLDRRAQRTYRAVGAAFQLLGTSIWFGLAGVLAGLMATSAVLLAHRARSAVAEVPGKLT